MPSLRSRHPLCLMGYTGSVPFCLPQAVTWSYQPCIKLQHASQGLSLLHYNATSFRNPTGNQHDMYYILRREHAQFLHIEHALWGVLFGEAALTDTSARAGLALPRRCQRQLATRAPCQPAWPPCLWMVLLSKVAVRTLERAAINTT